MIGAVSGSTPARKIQTMNADLSNPARDIQGLEMNPLGPFNGKSFGTTISPWVVPLEAVQPFECAAQQFDIPRPTYLQDPKGAPHYAVHLQVDLFDSKQNQAITVCRSRLEWLYY